jgi:hypothetical protein
MRLIRRAAKPNRPGARTINCSNASRVGAAAEGLLDIAVEYRARTGE